MSCEKLRRVHKPMILRTRTYVRALEREGFTRGKASWLSETLVFPGMGVQYVQAPWSTSKSEGFVRPQVRGTMGR